MSTPTGSPALGGARDSANELFRNGGSFRISQEVVAGELLVIPCGAVGVLVNPGSALSGEVQYVGQPVDSVIDGGELSHGFISRSRNPPGRWSALRLPWVLIYTLKRVMQ